MNDWLDGRGLTERTFLTEWERAAAAGAGDALTLDRPQLVVFRCDARKHQLGAIYLVPAGKLFLSTSRTLHQLEPELDLPSKMRRVRSPEPRMPEVDEPGSDRPVSVSCRCGRWPDLTRDDLRAALALPRPRSGPVVVTVSSTGPSTP